MQVPTLPAVRKTVQAQARFAMPIGGLNYRSNFMDFPVTDAYLLDNLIPRTNGLEVRKGWAHWVPELDRFQGEVRSIMVFNGGSEANSRLFCSDSGTGKVWNITIPEIPPAEALVPATNSLRAGEWYDTHFTTEAGNYLCIVSAGAGYFTYSTADGWVDRSALVTFPVGPPADTTTAKDFDFIWTWKNRIWFLKKDTSIAYYLPLDSIQGAAKKFDFGQQLSLGGPLSFGTNWTYDSGAGIDDSLVLVSQLGELLIYQGTDPSNATTFSLKGLWYIGEVPVGRRGFCQHGGSVLILCTYGLITMEDVIAGRISATDISSGVAGKVNQSLATRISERLNEYYWHITVHPHQALIVLATPIYLNELNTYQEMGMNSITNAWCTFTGMDILCSVIWKGQYLFGTRTGGVKLGFHGGQDGTTILGDVDADDITGRFQNGFDAFQTPNMNKRMLRIKAYGLVARTGLTFLARFQPEYSLGDDIYAPPVDTRVLPFWDRAIWDEGIWAAGAGSFHQWFGVNGFGKKMSLQFAMRGGGTVLATDYEVLYEVGIGL
jgi:hypothetical protein